MQSKIASFHSLGFGGNPRELTIATRAKDKAELWNGISDLGVGLRSTFPGYVSTSTFQKRFGIKRRISRVYASSGEVEFKAPAVASGRMRLATVAGASFETECEVFRACGVFPFLPAEHDKFRFAAPHFSLILPYSPAATAPGAVTKCEDPRTTARVGRWGSRYYSATLILHFHASPGSPLCHCFKVVLTFG